MRGRDAVIVGKIVIDNRVSQRPLLMTHLEHLSVYAALAAIAIQQARLFQDLESEVERRAARLQTSQQRHRNLFQNMLDGTAYHRIILDDDGKPIDYVFLEANIAFEKLTGLKRTKVIGRRVSEVLPQLLESEFDWIGTYGKVALQGGVRSFKQYAEPLDKWFDVSAYSPEKDYFVSIFQDVTDRRNAIEELLKSEEGLRKRSGRQQALLMIRERVQGMSKPDDLETVLLTCLQELQSLGVNASTIAVHRIVDPQKRLVWTCRINSEGLIAPLLKEDPQRLHANGKTRYRQ